MKTNKKTSMKTNKKTSTETSNVILHGEAMLFNVAAIPGDAKEIKPSNIHYHVIADSETTGNHHVVDAGEGVFFYITEDNKLFMRNTTETRVRCLHENRHSTIVVPPGVWETAKQVEFDYITLQQREVRD